MTTPPSIYKESYALTYYVFFKQIRASKIFTNVASPSKLMKEIEFRCKFRKWKCPNAHANGSLREVWSQPLLHDLSQWICAEEPEELSFPWHSALILHPTSPDPYHRPNTFFWFFHQLCQSTSARPFGCTAPKPQSPHYQVNPGEHIQRSIQLPLWTNRYKFSNMHVFFLFAYSQTFALRTPGFWSFSSWGSVYNTWAAAPQQSLNTKACSNETYKENSRDYRQRRQYDDWAAS